MGRKKQDNVSISEAEKNTAEHVIIFGIRHLSPAVTWHLRRLLDEVQPQAVLVEGPSDFTEELGHLVSQGTKPPVAVMTTLALMVYSVPSTRSRALAPTTLPLASVISS